jgi:hypothetical protein
MRQNEYHIQVAVVFWLVNQYPRCLFTISPSGMKLPVQVAIKMQRMGYKAGTPDLMIFEPRGGYHGLFIELKADSGKKSVQQCAFIQALNDRGYKAVFAFGFEEARNVISEYLSTRKEVI